MSHLPVLCLIHGHGVDASIWDGIYADLVSDAQVLKPDFARLTNHKTIEAYAEDLYARLQSAQVSSVVLVGHSMGGYMALAFAEQHPEMVQGLILYHSTATADDEKRKEIRRQTIDELKAQGTVPFIQKQLPKMVATTYPSEKTQVLIDRFLDLPVDALIAGVEAIAGRPDRTNVLRTAQFPILLVLGREDQLMPFEKTAQQAELSDKITVTPIENAGHLSMVEQPEAAIQAIRSFIAQL
ncbi:alpha/beta fold hydrolase [Spirosoma endophyticum]|uniref:Pimeloyl-ACP methyl ester carboxylesterase n=1 Tax=Spirosoma endophyticum TaxID=662367 RepID=A0A1I1TYC4_9BACT|nr:alpha/beta hydrolase [Spirosoma endophyticum]SFD63612.1 Pimeloyl-ACP methyl ester carboxylesterase [Spirosoma endophyticum]